MLFETWIVARHPEAVPLFLLVTDAVLLDEDALSKVFEQLCLEVVKLVVGIVFDSIASHVLVDLRSSFEGVAVVVTQREELVYLVLAGFLDLIKQ